MNDNLIILASGWTKPDLLWAPMTHRFRSMGYDVLLVKMPGRGFGPIEESALAVGVLLEKLDRHYEQIVFIGHSMGGLVGRYAIQVLELDAINAYVSLGTPHRGSWLARLAPWSRSAAQMRPGSEFLRDLDAREWPDGVPALGLQAQYEEIVLPRSSALIPFGANITIPRAIHGTMPLHGQTSYEIWAWLNLTLKEMSAEPVQMDPHGVASQVQLG